MTLISLYQEGIDAGSNILPNLSIICKLFIRLCLLQFFIKTSSHFIKSGNVSNSNVHLAISVKAFISPFAFRRNFSTILGKPLIGALCTHVDFFVGSHDIFVHSLHTRFGMLATLSIKESSIGFHVCCAISL
ncbi:hypothetical protein GW750_06310 [bacterium]|nr:hypothetical protein [bacterium]